MTEPSDPFAPRPEQPALPAPPPAYPGQPVTPPVGLAVAALVLGILACLLFWIPFGGIILGLVGLVLGIVAWRRASTGRAGGKAMAVVGTVLGGLAVAGGILATVVIILVFGRVSHCIDVNLTDQQLEDCINQEFGVG
jgi:hypothetical protein